MIPLSQSMIRLIHLADIISILNALFGFLAVLILILNSGLSNELQIRLAVTFIFLALLADGLDGIIARKKGIGPLGEYIEAMADMSSMVIAPALITLVLFQQSVLEKPFVHLLLVFVIILYLICGIIRLAAFHPLKHKETFLGLPASAATLTVLIMGVFYASFLFIILLMILISLLMVLPIPYPKPTGKINALTACLILISIIVWDLFYTIGPMILLLCLFFYILIGPFIQHKKQRAMEQKRINS